MVLAACRTRASLVALAALLGACEAERAIDPKVAPSITAFGGDYQTGLAGQPLPALLKVRVTRGGLSVAGQRIDWTSIRGGGTLTPAIGQTDASGEATSQWTLGRVAGIQAARATVLGDTPLSVSFEATADAPPLILHYDGRAWTTQLGDTTGLTVRLNGIWGASSSRVFAVGTSCGGATILQFDGVRWGPLPASCSAPIAGATSVSGRSPTDVFAVVRTALPPFFASSVIHFDGQSWTTSFTSGCSFCGAHLSAIWAAPGTDVWAVGDSGVVRHFDGREWTTQSSGTLQGLRDVWGATTNRIFVVGSSGTTLEFDGNAWTQRPSGSTAILNAVRGSSATDVFAVGAGGTILHFDGSAWSAQASGTTQDLYGLWVRAPDDVYAVGNLGTLLHYDGTRWTAQQSGMSRDLRGVWGSSASDIFVVGARSY
jgi:hypothetical protein